MESEEEHLVFIERARQERLTPEEVKVYDQFLSEAGVNFNKISEADPELIAKFFHESGASNEFIANTINRLAQVLPTNVISRILLSDNDYDGVPLYRELELGSNVITNELLPVSSTTPPQKSIIKEKQSDLEL